MSRVHVIWAVMSDDASPGRQSLLRDLEPDQVAEKEHLDISQGMSVRAHRQRREPSVQAQHARESVAAKSFEDLWHLCEIDR